MEPKAAAGQVVYEDFVPLFKLAREEGIDTLIMELAEFKKEEIRVQVDSFGSLSVSGERPLADNRRSRFRSVFQIPEDSNEIRTRFEDGRLYVKVLPKLMAETSMETAIKIKETRLKEQATQVQKPKEIQKPAEETKPSISKDDMNQKATPKPSAKLNGVAKKQQDEKRGEPTDTRKEAEKVVEKEKDQIEEKKEMEKLMEPEWVLGFSHPMRILLNVIVAVVILVVMALYVTSKN